MFTPPYSVKGDRSLTTLIWVHIKYRYELSMLYMFRFLHVTDTYMYSIRCFRAVIFRLLVILFVKPIGTFQFLTKHITLCRWCGMQVVRRWSSLYYGSLYWYVTIYTLFWIISLSDVNVFIATFFFHASYAVVHVHIHKYVNPSAVHSARIYSVQFFTNKNNGKVFI